MDNILKNRLEQELDVMTTCYDYGILLHLLAHKTNKKVDDLREGKGYWTYKDWNVELNKYA